MAKFKSGDIIYISWDSSNYLVRIIGSGITTENAWFSTEETYCLSSMVGRTADIDCHFIDSYGIYVGKDKEWAEILYGN